MGSDQVLTQAQAWSVYDRCFADGRTFLLDEPSRIELRFRALSQDRRPSAKDWADSYLAAFTTEAGLCLVTLDQALYRKAQEGILLA